MDTLAELERVKAELAFYKKLANDISPRKTAIALGEKTYQGTPCKNGHTTRSTYNNNCTECKKINTRKTPTVEKKTVKKTQAPAPVVLKPVQPTPKEKTQTLPSYRKPEKKGIDPKIMHAHQQRREIQQHTKEAWDEDI